MKLSVVIIARNEEANIGRCLESVKWADEIILIDNNSDDRTVEIARQYNAQVYNHDWNGYGPAKQAGLERASGKWILSIDADEVVSSELAAEINRICVQNDNANGYYIPRLTSFLGRWIRHSQWYPDYVLRLFKRTKGRFTDSLVHESVEIDGVVKYLKNDLLHYSYPDLKTFFKKTARYSELGALEAHRKGHKAGSLTAFFHSGAAFYRHFIFRAGFLDGWEGFLIALLSANRVYKKYSILRSLDNK